LKFSSSKTWDQDPDYLKKLGSGFGFTKLPENISYMGKKEIPFLSSSSEIRILAQGFPLPDLPVAAETLVDGLDVLRQVGPFYRQAKKEESIYCHQK
jgi:hypothetical protein